jgi:hypothetical protein
MESNGSEAFADSFSAFKIRYYGPLLFTADQKQPWKGVSNDTGRVDTVGEAEQELR